jgi:erythromycin esterase-like protein
MGEAGEWNVGQLVRERHAEEAFNVGFTASTGTVTAASNWDEPPQRTRVRPALPESYEGLFHAVGSPRFFLGLSGGPERLVMGLRQPRLERAIGVIYRPETERLSHYFRARLSDQFDAVLHYDETRALEPLERTAGWETGDAPETYPVAV